MPSTQRQPLGGARSFRQPESDAAGQHYRDSPRDVNRGPFAQPHDHSKDSGFSRDRILEEGLNTYRRRSPSRNNPNKHPTPRPNTPTSYISSSGSSVASRISARSSASSCTSSDESPPKSRSALVNRNRVSHSSGRPDALEESRDPAQQGPGENTPKSDGGATIWGKVRAVAGSLTVNVGRVWDGDVNQDGEEDRESHITNVLKEYYVAKARVASDLPEWLFEPRDRAVLGGVSELQPRGGREESRDASVQPTPQPRRIPNAATGDTESKASNRLKALRDARKTGARPVEPTPMGMNSEQESQHHPRIRLGLPSGPGRRVRGQGE